ncbi:unnamed protein product [Adineta ricciae]|uniref:Uncharacterized protein n=1 Tax=Adineta ricciae TaxID=249248 RepID=A0A813V9F5_ADIRI|nr:unnamed protein product [Adineta ricciae]CAF1039675.1 unnamed protein product [Adineta ricciae]
MHPNQQPPLYTTRHYIHNPQSNPSSRPPAPPYPYYTNNQPPTSVTYINDRPNYGQPMRPQQPQSYASPNTTNYPPAQPRPPPPPTQNNFNRSSYGGPAGGVGGGGIEKTNIMSNESPFHDPARGYEQYNAQRTVTSITSPPKGGGNIEKTNMMSNESPFHDPARGYEQYNAQRTATSITSPPKGGGNIEKTNMMSNESPFHDPARRHEQYNAPRTVTSITTPPKGDGGLNKTLNLSEESPFHAVYAGYHYPSQIDPTKRITNQNSGARSTDNKSLNLSDENPFHSIYGGYHYPSQIDPAKRITEIPKAGGPLSATNDMSRENPFNSYRPPSPRNYPPGPAPNSYPSNNDNWDRNNNMGQPANRYSQGQNQPPPPPQQPNYYNQPQPSSMRPPSPPVHQPPVRPQPQKANPSAPLDKTSLNMSPDNPFASSYGQYHYPSPEEIKAQKRAAEHMNRYGDQQPVNSTRPGPPANQMTEYPETEKKDVMVGKGNTKFSRFDVNM